MVAGLYVGKSNVGNIELLMERALMEKPLLILEDESFEERDYTGGTATELYRGIKSMNTVVLTDEERLVEEILKAVDVNGRK